MRNRIGRLLAWVGTVVFTAVCAFAIIQQSGAGEIFRGNRQCCQLSLTRNVQVTFNEVSGRQQYFGEIGQDKWVLERVFPGVTNGYFVDIGSGHPFTETQCPPCPCLHGPRLGQGRGTQARQPLVLTLANFMRKREVRSSAESNALEHRFKHGEKRLVRKSLTIL